jgi:hypothetical protein
MSREYCCLFSMVSMLWCGPAGAGDERGYQTISPDYVAMTEASTELVLVHPFAPRSGVVIRGLRWSVDDEAETSCATGEPAEGRCARPVHIEPGPHVVTVTRCARADCATAGPTWRTFTRLTAGLQERVTLDVGRLDSGGAAAHARLPGARRSACVLAVERAVTGTCRAEGFATLPRRVDAARRACRAAWPHASDDVTHRALLVQWLAPQRCYTAAELERLPPELMRYTAPTFWPPGSVARGFPSWTWARYVAVDATTTGTALLRQTRETVQRWLERQVVVDQLIDAYLDPERGVPALVAAAQTAPRSSDPTEPTGHRLYMLGKLAGPGGRFRTNATLQAVLAAPKPAL